MPDPVVLVTGGARRVGAAIGRMLHASGARVMIHFHASEGAARELQAELEAMRPGSAAIVRGDLLDVPGLSRLVSETVERFGRLDVLVNNASSFFPTPVGGISGTHWDDLVGTAPHLRAAGGCIVNIVDIHVDRPMQGHLVYNAAKGGLVALTRSLARELGPEVRVNGVAPGPILWPDDEAWSDEQERRRIIDTTLLKRCGEPDDIARTVRFLVGDAPYITGQVIAVDGGRSVHL